MEKEVNSDQLFRSLLKGELLLEEGLFVGASSFYFFCAFRKEYGKFGMKGIFFFLALHSIIEEKERAYKLC